MSTALSYPQLLFRRFLTRFFLQVFFVSSILTSGWAEVEPRSIASFDQGWKFHQGEASQASEPTYDDTSWRAVDIPHDWMIEGPFDKNSPAGPGGGYLNGGKGWYRKTFTLPEASKGKRFVILFDGAYMNSQVWLNGKLLGTRPYGFSSFYYDMTSDLHFGDEKNVLAVSLDVQQPNCRWYTGAGLYRHVWLITTDPVHFGQWGTYVTTPKVSPSAAEVKMEIKVRNDSASPSDVDLTVRLFDAAGKEVGHQNGKQSVPAQGETTFDQLLSVAKPSLWSPDSPALYRAVAELRVDGILTDRLTTPFGIRTIAFTKDKGFFLNGQRFQINGVSNHQDLGCLGAVALRRGYERQLELLKEMGCNAIKTAHNPPSPEFLDLCDQMGFLVMDEVFDEWKDPKTEYGYGRFFDEWSSRDLSAMIHRDRNHPSIILWNIGNEVREGRVGEGLTAAPLAKHLVEQCHREDPSRPVTSSCNEPGTAWAGGLGLATELDIFGVSYNPTFYIRNDPAYLDKTRDSNKPGDYNGDLPMIGSETASGISTRGEYGLTLDAQGNVQKNANLNFMIPEYGDFPEKFKNRTERSLLAIKNSPWVAGEFVWTGFDYLGEPSPYRWPARSSTFGIFDLCGFPKDRYYLYKSQWRKEPVVHVLPHWTWPGFEGKSIPVWVFTNADTVELFLNGQSLGVKNFPADTEVVRFQPTTIPNAIGAADAPQETPRKEPSLHLVWDVPYAPGILKAVAKKKGEIVATDEVHTAGAPATIRLTPDRKELMANGQDLSFIKVEILDKDGNVCPNAENLIRFKIEGSAASIAGLDNGDATSHEPFQGAQYKAFHGLALAVLRTKYETTGKVTLTASSDGLSSVTTTVNVGAP